MEPSASSAPSVPRAESPVPGSSPDRSAWGTGGRRGSPGPGVYAERHTCAHSLVVVTSDFKDPQVMAKVSLDFTDSWPLGIVCRL